MTVRTYYHLARIASDHRESEQAAFTSWIRHDCYPMRQMITRFPLICVSIEGRSPGFRRRREDSIRLNRTNETLQFIDYLSVGPWQP